MEVLILEILKIVAPVAIAYFGYVKNQNDVDHLAAKQPGREGRMRSRWYRRTKPIEEPKT